MPLKRMLWTAVAAGLIAGLVATLAQAVFLTPMILEAEGYELGTAPGARNAAPAHPLDGLPRGSAGHDDYRGQWATGEAPERAHGAGVARTLLTAGSHIALGVGFALMLTAAYGLRGLRRWWEGAVWGLAGFAVFQLIPALGLPPVLPGVAEAALGARQAWWLTAVACAGVGLGLAVLSGRPALRVLGVAILVTPHWVGAPGGSPEPGLLPAELERQFVPAALAVGALFWLALGAVSGAVYAREQRHETDAERALASVPP